MLKRVFTIFILFALNNIYSQEKDTSLIKSNFFLNIGFSYIPLDYIGGPSIGLTLTNKEKPLGITLRSDYLIKIGRGSFYNAFDTITNTPISITQSDKIEVLRFNQLIYIDIEYKLNKKPKCPLIAGLGFGWINTGEIENILLNRYHGYATLSPKLSYRHSWISFELRGNIPIKNNYFKSYYPFQRLVPLEFSMYYRFNPANFTKT